MVLTGAWPAITCLHEVGLLTLKLVWRLLCEPYGRCCYALASSPKQSKLDGLVWEPLRRFPPISGCA